MNFNYWEYKDFMYDPWVESDPDKFTIYHHVRCLRTKELIDNVPISGYAKLSKEAFEAWIDSGMPSRNDIGLKLGKRMSSPPTNEELIEYRVEQLLLGENDE